MPVIQIESVASPLGDDDDLLRDALWLFAFADFVGMVPSGTRELSPATLEPVLAALRHHDIGRSVWVASVAQTGSKKGPGGASRWRKLLDATRESVEMSPMPEAEWEPVAKILDEEPLADMLGVSASSLRRYRTRARPTPAVIAARLHVLALVIADLAGSYNDFGVQRWFERARTQLGGRSPRQLLAGGFDPDGDAAIAVRRLSSALAGASAT